MKIRLMVLVIFIFGGSCSNDRSERRAIFTTQLGQIAKGMYAQDSLLHGTVEFFDPNTNKYLGYTNFSYGYEIGPYVHFKNGLMSDSFAYNTPLKNGVEFLYDNNRRLIYKAYMLDGRVVGPVTEYNTSGNLSRFYFYNFEGDIIYQAKYDTNGRYERGSTINIKVHDRNINEKDNQVLFLYIIRVPDCESYYELSILDENRKVVDSRKIETNNFYFETKLDSIPSNQHYAIVYHYTCASQKEGNVIIQEILEK